MSMRLLLSILLLVAGPAVAQGSHPVSMWKIEGGDNVVYLLGSVHLLRRDDHPLPAVIEAAYDDAESLYMELDMDELDPAAVQAASNRLGLIDGGGTLAQVMGDARYAEAATLAAAMDIPFELLSRTEPWLAAVTVEQMALLRIGFNPLYGIEMHLAMKASQEGKPIDGFETVDEQLRFLDGLSIDAQIDLLMQALADGAALEALMDEMIDAWRHGDVAFLERMMLEDMSAMPELYETIVVDRNRRWADAIEELLDDDQDYLVVVGALHLVGDDGLPALLSGRGIEIGQMHESF